MREKFLLKSSLEITLCPDCVKCRSKCIPREMLAL